MRAVGLPERVARALRSEEEWAVPERAGERAEGGDVRRARRAVLVRNDERREDVLPRGVVEAVGVGLDGRRTGDGLREDVSDEVALARVVPGDDLHEVGLELEDLSNPLRQVETAQTVEVLVGVDVFELERGQGCEGIRFAVLPVGEGEDVRIM